MFTGIIQGIGQILAVEGGATGRRLKVRTHYDDLCVGESIAVDGVCVTVVQPEADVFSCDLSAETLSLTTLSHLKVGDRINLERALRLSDRLGGHWVTGHVDQVAVVEVVEDQAGCRLMRIGGIEVEACALLVHKGSVAVNGVSLTVNAVDAEGFSVMLIPQTLSETDLSDLEVGDTVNVEFDTLVKMVRRQVDYALAH